MTKKIKTLDWDSNFFGFQIGLLGDSYSYFESSHIEKYDLLIDKALENRTLNLTHFSLSFEECKVIYSKKINDLDFKSSTSILDEDEQHVLPSDLYKLAYESGKHSRFKLDNKFDIAKFKKLYQKWVENSLNKTFASKVFYVKDVSEIIGFITIKKNKDYAEIGLIAVSEKYQGQGIGKQLLKKAEAYCLSQDIDELKIPTQKSNTKACAFYQKNGYNIQDELFIKHYWRNTL